MSKYNLVLGRVVAADLTGMIGNIERTSPETGDQK